MVSYHLLLALGSSITEKKNNNNNNKKQAHQRKHPKNEFLKKRFGLTIGTGTAGCVSSCA
jgi:hypothetical protein